MIQELKKESQKLKVLDYPCLIQNILRYFSENIEAEHAFIYVNKEIKQVSFKEILPLIISCDINSCVCLSQLPVIILKTPVIIELTESESIIMQKLTEAIDKEYPVILTLQGKFYGQIPFKRLIFAIKNIEIKNALLVNPLTGLPGNHQIQKQYLLQKEPFLIGYFDLNNFKPYNDKYGVAAGDNVIKFVANFLKQSLPDDFVGHIGGDDFIIICNSTKEKLFNMLQEINSQLKNMHSEKDINQGYINALDRYGKVIKFPLLSGALAVILVKNKVDFATITKELAKLKAIAKDKIKRNEIPFEFLHFE